MAWSAEQFSTFSRHDFLTKGKAEPNWDVVKTSVSRVSHHHSLGFTCAHHQCPPETPLSPLLLPRPSHHLSHPPPGGWALGLLGWPREPGPGPALPWVVLAGAQARQASCSWCPSGVGCWGLPEQLFLQDGGAGSKKPVFPQGRSSKFPCCFMLGDRREGKEETAIHVRDRHS